jgi:centromere protein J
VTCYPDGLEVIEFENGQVEKRFPDQALEVIFPDKTVQKTYPNGDQVVTFPNGNVHRYVAQEDAHIIEFSDGTKVNRNVSRRRCEEIVMNLRRCTARNIVLELWLMVR